MSIPKKYYVSSGFLVSTLKLYAQNEIKPDGDKIIWGLLVAVVIIIVLLLTGKRRNKQKPLIAKPKLKIDIEKNRLYFPDCLKMTIKNTGNCDIDLDRPLMIFDNFWLKRKFRLRGIDNYMIYPLYLEKGKNHSLKIDLNHFYSYDRKLKKYPKVKITIFDVKGKKLGSKSVFLRKTLIKF